MSELIASMLDSGTILGPFRVEKELGSGAMGTVFKCTYAETGQPVALKVIAMGLIGNDTAMDRFEREYKILRQLDHPHIVKLYATGRYKKTPFFAMEYVRGESLDRILSRRTKLGWEEVVQLGKQLCQALQHAHEKGIIHRDLKPSNLMILRDGTLKLTDFGIAKDSDATALTGTHSTVGTAAYMSPEQCKGERNLTPKSDLYSLGVVLYELLTGEKPFKKDSPVDMFMAHVNEPFERPSRRVLDIPPWLDTLVCQLMEKKPEHRPYDAAMVSRALNEVETKMTDQRSAGLDAATARIADRSDTVRADVADRDAARALRGAAKRKKIRVKSKPFYEQNWFLAVSLPLALAGIAGLVWLLLRPPSPTEYYNRANAAIKAGNFDAARETLREYVTTYPSGGDANAEQMRTWLEQFEAERLDRQMQKRLRMELKIDGDAEQIVRDALIRENKGEVNSAQERWRDLGLLFISAETIDDKAWGWLAKRKIEAIKGLKDLEEHLARLETKTTIDAERIASEAVRLERLQDVAAARERWASLKEQQFTKEFEARNYVVLAAAKYAELKNKPPTTPDDILKTRQTLLAKRMEEVDRFVKENTPFSIRQARALAADIVDLYRDDPDTALKPLVLRATKCLEDHPQ
jgi:eukaryotic-like serine/threonine-protein kinase